MSDFLSRFMFATPDFGHSDLLSLNLSLKFLLSDTLKSNYLPIWSKDIGTGFPVFAEGQIGMLNIFNLLAFKFLAPIAAFNLGYIFIFATTFFGSYLYARTIKLSKTTGLFLGTIFSLSGIFVTHVSHFNLIQTASFLPWEFFLLEKFFQSSQKRWLFGLSFVISQQVFSGHPQVAFISLFGLSLYALLKLRQSFSLWQTTLIILSIFFGLLLATPQILASVQLIQSSFRQGINVLEMSRFPYLPQYLLTFLNPYLFGDPRIGTYPPFSQNWGIFWETTGYLGLLPFVLFLCALFRKKTSYQKIFLVTALISLVLLLGKYTPFFFIFQILPFSLFRVPARFLILFVWAIAIISSITFDQIPQKTLRTIILFLALINIVVFALGYNPVIASKSWTTPPPVVSFFKKDSSWFRVYSLSASEQWNKIFTTEGWKNPKKYSALRNSLDPNENLIWQVSSVDYSHSGLAPRRLDLFNNLLSQGIVSGKNSFSVSTESAKLLNLSGVKYLISPQKISTQSAVSFPIASVTDGQTPFYIYLNSSSLPHAFMTDNYVTADSVTNLEQKLTDPTINQVILESPIELPPEPNFSGQVNILENSDLEVRLKTNSNTKGLLVLTDSYYPGWVAKINGQTVPIMPANLNQRAVLVPPGQHEVDFKFEPYKFFN